MKDEIKKGKIICLKCEKSFMSVDRVRYRLCYKCRHEIMYQAEIYGIPILSNTKSKKKVKC